MSAYVRTHTHARVRPHTHACTHLRMLHSLCTCMCAMRVCVCVCVCVCVKTPMYPCNLRTVLLPTLGARACLNPRIRRSLARSTCYLSCTAGPPFPHRHAGLGSPLPQLPRDWAHHSNTSTEYGLTPTTSPSKSGLPPAAKLCIYICINEYMYIYIYIYIDIDIYICI